MVEASTRSVVARIPARRIVWRGHAAHSAECPFCRVEAVNVDDTNEGCEHVEDLDHARSGSYFIFERPVGESTCQI